MTRYKNVTVKISAFYALGEKKAPYHDLAPLIKQVYDAFGPQRLMWGTNFPGVLHGTGYARSLELFRHHVDFLTAEDKEWIFSRTPLEVWKFGDNESRSG